MKTIVTVLMISALAGLPGCSLETGGGKDVDGGHDGGPDCIDDCRLDETVCEAEGFRTCGNFDPDDCAEWSQVTACAELERCEDGACVTICEHECDPGQARCEEGAAQACADIDDDPCREWDAPVACARNQVCQDGVCTEVCTDDCADGNRRCQDGAAELCGDFDDDPCFEWGEHTECGYGLQCDEGACVEVCSDACSQYEKRCDVGESFESCGQYDQDECLEWGGLTDCDPGKVCRDGQCECDHECSAFSARCAPDGSAAYQECGDPDGDSCREWEEPVACDPGYRCAAGACRPDCNQECDDGERRCVGGGVEAWEVCGEFDADVCREFGEPTDCPAGLVCNMFDASCRPPYPDGPYGTQVGDTIIDLCLDLGGCGQEGVICLDEYLDAEAILIMVHTGWCIYCQTQLATAEAFYQAHQADGLVMIQVLFEDDQYDSSEDALRDWACYEDTTYDFSFPITIDPDNQATGQYFDEGGVPLNIVVDNGPDGDMVITYKVEGYDPQSLAAAVDDALEN